LGWVIPPDPPYPSQSAIIERFIENENKHLPRHTNRNQIKTRGEIKTCTMGEKAKTKANQEQSSAKRKTSSCSSQMRHILRYKIQDTICNMQYTRYREAESQRYSLCRLLRFPLSPAVLVMNQAIVEALLFCFKRYSCWVMGRGNWPGKRVNADVNPEEWCEKARISPGYRYKLRMGPSLTNCLFSRLFGESPLVLYFFS